MVARIYNPLVENSRELAQTSIFVLLVSLVVFDSLGTIELSWVSVSLLMLLLTVTMLDNLKRLDIGEFGGVEFSEEIDHAQNLIEKLNPSSNSSDEDHASDESDSAETQSEVQEYSETERTELGEEVGGRTHEIAARLHDLLEKNPRSALVQLRMELEKAEKKKAEELGSDVSEIYKNTDTNATLQTIDNDLMEANLEVRKLCNKAIHSTKDIDKDEAARVIDLGLRVLDHLIYYD